MENQELSQEVKEKINKITGEFEEKIKKIQANYEPRKQQIEEDYPNPEGWEAGIGIDVNVEWVDTSLKFDLPQFTMKTQAISFDLPSVTMELSSISFNVPETYMDRVCVTKVPKWYGPFKVKMECIYMDVPKVRSKRIDIKLDIPKITSNRVEWKFDIPEVKMETTEIVLTLPQITFKEVSTTIAQKRDAYSKMAQDMTAEINSEQIKMQAQIKNEIMLPLSSDIQQRRQEMFSQREQLCKSFDVPIQLMKNTINTLKQNNAFEKVSELENQLSDLVTRYQTALTSFDKTIDELSQHEKLILEKI